ncbi:MAG: zinc-dependent metalloprotease family protein [Amphritea sp.]
MVVVNLGSWLKWQLVAFFSVLILFGVDSTLARDARSFGANSPFSINELPPGILRSQLLSLPPAAQNRALGWLHRFEFTEQDVPFLRVDRAGGVFYEDPALDGEQAEPAESGSPAVAELALNEVFTLHSKPGASRVVYLDMDGHVVSGTAWNSAADPLYMRPYDSDANEASFSQSELNAIAETWKRVAEDFAPFDIDVTTEEPPAFGPQVGHILVTRKADEYGNEIYSCGCGGVAYVGVWGTSYYTDYQPALVFLDGLSGPHNISEAAAHELGHNLSLSHDGVSGGSGYYSGHGSGYIDWGPIMGVGYYAQVSQWGKGEYSGANNAQDDLQLIANRLTYRNDDHEDLLFAFATPLTITDGIYVYATNPVTDPANIDPGNKGIIEHRSDIDLFYMDVGPGTVNLTITPAWTDYFTSQSRRGMNLDVEVALYDEFGTLLALSNPVNDTYAQINIDVGAGRYILAIDGVGVGDPLIDGYSDYGSLGQFFITGTVPQDVVSSAPPPAPTDLVSIPNGDVNIDLLWTDPASLADNDETGYRIYRQLDGGAFVQIATIGRNSQSYSDNNLFSGAYVYRVEPYNSAGFSTSNQTQAVVISAPSYANASGESTMAGAVISGTYMDTTVSSGYERLAEQHQGGKPKNRVSQLEHIWNITGVAPGALVSLEVDAQALANTDGDDYQFSYSLDGVNYEPLGLLLNGGSSQLMSVTLPVGTFGTVKVKVTDTDRTIGNGGQDSVDIYRIVVLSAGDPDEMPPVVVISTPQNNYSAEQGIAIAFSSTANDAEDGDLTSNISWHSDQDGEIGQGPDISVNNLSPGQHQVAAEVTDTAGATGSDAIAVTITQPDPPAGSLSVASATSFTIADLAAGNAVSTLSGTGFAGNMSVVFQNGVGPTPLASSITVNSGSQMTVNIAATSGGPRKNRYWDVVVTDANGNSAVCQSCLMISR